MKRITWGALALGLLWITSSCSMAMPGTESDYTRAFGFSNFERGRFADTDDDGLPDTRLGTISKLDDVTNTTGDGQWAASLDTGIPILGKTPFTSFFFKEESEGEATAPKADPKAPKTPKSERKMIYTASFGVMVPTIDEAVHKLLARVEELGGYLSQRQDATLMVRIPADKFQAFVKEVPKFGRVVSESMRANDVTNQHTDLMIRLENAEKSRKRLLALLDKATKMEDVIKIETALRRITGEIERMKGQLKLLNNQIKYSTVTVGFHANAPTAKPKKRRKNSRFPWINRMGVQQDMRRF